MDKQNEKLVKLITNKLKKINDTEYIKFIYHIVMSKEEDKEEQSNVH